MAPSDPPDYVARAGVVLLALSSAFYLVGLDRLPIALGGDEVLFAIHAESLARSGQDLNGTRWPAFVLITDPLIPNHSSTVWYQPVLFYVMMPFIKALGVSEWSVRLPVALIAIVNSWLVLAAARHLFSRRIAIVVALLLALTPAHVIAARQARDYIVLLPFVLGWLLCLWRFLDGANPRALAAGTFILGAGMFSYIAAWLLMPMLFLLTIVTVWRSGPAGRRALGPATATFVVPLAALVMALLSTPGALSETMSRYAIAGAAAATPDLSSRAALYWDYFNPSFLFFAGGSNPTQATGQVGVFLLALAPLMVAGVRDIVTGGSTRGRLLIAVLLLTPLPVAITMPPAASYSIARTMPLVPFGVLVAGFGIRHLSRSGWGRMALVGLLSSVPIQFGMFVGDYRGDHQRRATQRLDPVNMSGVADAIVGIGSASPAPVIYFSDRLDDGGARWRFELLKRGRLDLWEHSKSINLDEQIGTIVPGALVIADANDRGAAALTASGYTAVATVTGVTGDAVTVVFSAAR